MDLSSVIIYLSVFGISLFFTRIVEFESSQIDRAKSLKNKKILVYIYSFFAILIPCLLAAFRDLNVGTDVTGYLIRNWNRAIRGNFTFWTFWSTYNTEIEIGFAFILYFCAQKANLFILLFLIEFLIITPTYLSLYLLRRKISMTTGMMTFFFLFYNIMLSMMRQGISESLLFLSLTLFFLKKKKSSILIFILSFLFHKSVLIVAFIIIFIYLIMKSSQRYKLQISLVIGLIILFVLYRYIAFSVAEVIGFFSERYSFYIKQYFGNAFNWKILQTTDLLFKSLLLFFLAFSIRYKHKRTYLSDFLLFMCFLGRYFMLFAVNFYESPRIAYYFDYFLIPFVPFVKKQYYSKSIFTDIVYEFFTQTFLFIFWAYSIMYKGVYETNIFSFRF